MSSRRSKTMKRNKTSINSGSSFINRAFRRLHGLASTCKKSANPDRVSSATNQNNECRHDKASVSDDSMVKADSDLMLPIEPKGNPPCECTKSKLANERPLPNFQDDSSYFVHRKGNVRFPGNSPVPCFRTDRDEFTFCVPLWRATPSLVVSNPSQCSLDQSRSIDSIKDHYFPDFDNGTSLKIVYQKDHTISSLEISNPSQFSLEKSSEMESSDFLRFQDTRAEAIIRHDKFSFPKRGKSCCL